MRRTLRRSPLSLIATVLVAQLFAATLAHSAVDENSGAAMLEIPIEAPPGPGGLAPQLALSYNSQAPDGPFGLGWQLGLGEIHCSSRFGVDPTGCGRVEMNGQLLTESSTANRYHTFVETFQLVVFNAQANQWDVTLPNGTLQRYGSTADSRVDSVSIQGATFTSRWLLSEIVDPFGNTIEIRYDADPDSDPDIDADTGAAYPVEISYASGQRIIRIEYEPRPDPIHLFPAGMERELTHRAVEIQVLSGGAVYRRLALRYDPLDSAITYATGRSRLAWIQQFGKDCPLTQSDPTQAQSGTCSGLPPQEFEYADSGHGLSGAGSQWEATAVSPNPYPNVGSFSAWHAIYSVPANLNDYPVQYGDVNGDGLVDVISGGWYMDSDFENPGQSYSSPMEVYLNDGEAWVKSDAWSNQLAGLQYARTRMEVTQVFIDVNHPEHAGRWFGFGACQVDSVSSVMRVIDDLGSNRRMAEASTAASPFYWPNQGGETSGAQVATWIEAKGRFRLQDVNSDGLADLVSSMELSPVTVNLNCDGTPRANPTVEGGGTQAVVFRNTGDGWVADPSLATGLPPLDYTHVEGHEHVASYGVGGSTSPLEAHRAMYLDEACKLHSMFGMHESYAADFCITYASMSPRFVDLNGDGFLDLIVGDLDPLQYDLPDIWGTGRAWVQDPTGPVRWKPAPEFDPVHSWTWTWTSASPVLICCPSVHEVYPGEEFVDLNGDGLVDQVDTDHGDVWINRGGGDPGVPGSAWCPADGECDWAARYRPPTIFRSDYSFPWSKAQFVDVNGDGRVDIVKYPEDAASQVWLQSGIPDGSGSVWTPAPSTFDLPVEFVLNALFVVWDPLFMDVNGDGVADQLYGHFTYSQNSSHLSKTSTPDLLTVHRNGQGREARFDYVAAAKQRVGLNDYDAAADATDHGEVAGPLDPPSSNESVLAWSPRAVVASVTETGPNQTDATTDYQYAYPQRDPKDRMGFGFRRVERRPPDGSKVTSYFYQKHGRAGRTSRRVVHLGTKRLSLYEEVWDVPTGLVQGSIVHPDVHVGRPLETRMTRTYGRFGINLGPTHRQTLTYDDTHGYNFVSQVDVERPSGDLRTVLIPEVADVGAGFVRLVKERQNEDPATGAILSKSTFTYTQGRIDDRTDLVQRRDGSDGPVDAVTDFEYDGFGNLIQRTDPNLHTTDYCYDGDGGWCPTFTNPVQATHSILVGVRVGDPLFKVRTYEPDPTSGAIVKVDSDYQDEPTIRRVLDPFDRVIEEYMQPFGGSEFLHSEVIYNDFAQPTPTIERRDFPDGATADYISEFVVTDGAGEVWKRITKNPSESAAGPFRGVAVFRDPMLRTSRETYPIPCGDETCSGLVGDVESPATVTKSDGLGRTVRVDTPDGFSLIEYRRAVRPQPAGSGAGDVFEAVLARNAKGDLTQWIVDGGRVVWVDECAYTVSPTQIALTGVSCVAADRAFYTYESTGEVSAIYDSTESYSDPNHSLRYSYDTLGRVWKIDDPDARASSITTYDPVGNVASITNARGQKTVYGHDVLGRLTSIDYPGSEEDVTVTYRPTETQREGMSAASYSQTYDYDGLGRLERTTYDVASTTGTHTMLLDYRYDNLGREIATIYPGNDTVVRHEYEGAYLRKVCEVQSEFSDCDDSNAHSYVDNVVYDDIGRRIRMEMPPGDREFDYWSTNHRLKQTVFTGTSPGNYSRTVDYDVYDQIGNVLAISGTSSTGAVSLWANYTYDERNRLSTWETSSGTEHFTYDQLGNLTGHGVANAGATNQIFSSSGPHQIEQNTDLGTSYTYDADGNRITETDASGTTYLTFDSQDRLVCKGTAPGLCDDLEVVYDADGNRVRTQGFVEEIYAGESFQRNVAGSGSSTTQIFAFGEQVAVKTADRGALRTASIGWLPSWHIKLPPSVGWAVLVLALVPMGWLAIYQVEWAVAARQAPAGSALAILLSVAIVMAPIPSAGGGGGPPRGGVQYWTLSDYLGSSSVWLTATGIPYRETVFKPFGQVHEEVSSGIRPPSVYAGHRRLAGEKDIYMQARWMSPETGTFLSIDPVVPNMSDPQSYNAYSYALNAPTRYTDPTGASPQIVIVANKIEEITISGRRIAGTTLSGGPFMLNDGPTLQAQTMMNAMGYNSSQDATTREPGTVYVTGHDLPFGQGHLALEFQENAEESDEMFDDLKTTTETASAGPDGGKLVGELNRPSDQPANNRTVGTVTPPRGVTPAEYWQSVRGALNAYGNNLDYDLGAGRLPGRAGDGYNSNGFVPGIVRATGGRINGSLSDFTGATRPVPRSAFGR